MPIHEKGGADTSDEVVRFQWLPHRKKKAAPESRNDFFKSAVAFRSRPHTRPTQTIREPALIFEISAVIAPGAQVGPHPALPNFGSGLAISQPKAESVNPVGAWSRRRDIPKDFCDRPGCYEPKTSSDRNTAKYCGNACRNAVHRVRRRERASRTMRYSWPSSPVNYSDSSAPEISLPHQKRSNQLDSKTSSQSQPRSPPSEM